ncbi:MAG: hypothetical protein V4510_07255 [bacterium]
MTTKLFRRVLVSLLLVVASSAAALPVAGLAQIRSPLWEGCMNGACSSALSAADTKPLPDRLALKDPTDMAASLRLESKDLADRSGGVADRGRAQVLALAHQAQVLAGRAADAASYLAGLGLADAAREMADLSARLDRLEADLMRMADTLAAWTFLQVAGASAWARETVDAVAADAADLAAWAQSEAGLLAADGSQLAEAAAGDAQRQAAETADQASGAADDLGVAAQRLADDAQDWAGDGADAGGAAAQAVLDSAGILVAWVGGYAGL